MYVSITGLKLRGWQQAPLFWWHAVRSLVAARRTPGNLSATSRQVDGWQHTLTAWEDRAAMRRFLVCSAHRGAMGVAGKLGVSRTCGFETDHAPGWDEALAHWRMHAREY